MPHYGAGHVGKEYWARPPLGHFRLEPPAHGAIGVDQVRRRVHHGTGPVLVPHRSDFAAQCVFRIADQPKRERAPGILPKGFVIFVRRLIDLRVANEPFAELPAVLGSLRTDAEDRNVVFLVPTVLIDKGRNLGPAPRSPLTAVEKDNRGRSLLQRRWKYDCIMIDIFQSRLRKHCADIQ